jgi:hypothetical protein
MGSRALFRGQAPSVVFLSIHSPRHCVLSVHRAELVAMLVLELRTSCHDRPTLWRRHLHAWVHKENRREAARGMAVRILESPHRHSRHRHRMPRDNQDGLGKVLGAAKGMPAVHPESWICAERRRKGPKAACTVGSVNGTLCQRFARARVPSEGGRTCRMPT